MDPIAIGGMVLTYFLTELMKKNPSLKEHAPLVVTIVSAVLGALQAALQATAASAQETAAVAHHANFVGSIGGYMLSNLAGSVGIHVGARKWFLDWFVNTVLKKALVPKA